ncbi:MAG: hypothetical protein NVS3B1_28820 [Marmoricola sp.]
MTDQEIEDDECKHGLDAAWCSLCRAPAPKSSQVASAATRFEQMRPWLFHVTAIENVDGIRRRGLRTASQLAAEAGVGLAGVRREMLHLAGATVRDQRPIISKSLAGHLDGVTLDDWLEILNSRVFLFPDQDRAKALSQTYAKLAQPQAVLVFRTTDVLAAAGDRLEVADRNTGAVPREKGCPCRGRSTFVALPDAPDLRRIQEVTVVDGLQGLDFSLHC